MNVKTLLSVLALSLLANPVHAQVQPAQSVPGAVQEPSANPIVEKYLISGKLDEGERVLEDKLRLDQGNDDIRFQLAILRFFQSIEHFGQTMYEYSPNSNLGMGLIPFLRFPVPPNDEPKAVELADIRRIFDTLISDLDRTYATLNKIKSEDLSVPINLFLIHLDFDRDGKVSEEEDMHDVLLFYFGRRNRGRDLDLSSVEFKFDRADAEWLKGYCCLLRAISEVFLAYDQTPIWESVGHRLFDRGIVKHDFLREEADQSDRWSTNYIMDFIAALHNSRLKLESPARMKTAHQHLLKTIEHSRDMWRRINAETDNDGEWVPSPKQSSPFLNARITAPMNETWQEFLNESEMLLKGEKLIPFWRGNNPKRGVNLHKFFHKPGDLDVINMVQGAGAVPYLEMGECTKPETWRQFQRTFRGDFFGFAVWIN